MKPEIEATRSPTDQSAEGGHHPSTLDDNVPAPAPRTDWLANHNVRTHEFVSDSKDMRTFNHDADAVFDDAVRLGNEIARRWNAGNDEASNREQ